MHLGRLARLGTIKYTEEEFEESELPKEIILEHSYYRVAMLPLLEK